MDHHEDLYRVLTEEGLPAYDPVPDLEIGLISIREAHQNTAMARLEAECARLRARVAELEAQVRQPAAADPDLRLLLDGVERLRARLYPATEVALPTAIHGVQLSRAQRHRVEEQVYAWRNPTDGSRPLSFKAIAERLGCTAQRARNLADQALARRQMAD